MRLDDTVTLTAPEIGDFVERASAFLEENGVEPRPTYHVALIFEEILTNVATHGGGGDGTAAVRIAIEPDHVQGEIVDTGHPFDPSAAPEPDVGAGIDERPIGGLGLFLVKRVSSAFGHARRDGRNVTTFSVPRQAATALEAR